jgi:hypothetical protein
MTGIILHHYDTKAAVARWKVVGPQRRRADECRERNPEVGGTTLKIHFGSPGPTTNLLGSAALIARPPIPKSDTP